LKQVEVVTKLLELFLLALLEPGLMSELVPLHAVHATGAGPPRTTHWILMVCPLVPRLSLHVVSMHCVQNALQMGAKLVVPTIMSL
jgi:hypothetical protein